MPRPKHRPPHDPVEDAIRRAGSIGALERLAGVEGSPDERWAFWKPFSRLPGMQALDAGVAELKRMIRAQAPASPKPGTRAKPRARHG